MEEQKTEEKKENCCTKVKNMKEHIGEGGSLVWCLGVIGAAVYFIGNASTFWMGVAGLLKALVWPAFLVYYAFEFLSK
jgi:hypothetical protein